MINTTSLRGRGSVPKDKANLLGNITGYLPLKNIYAIRKWKNRGRHYIRIYHKQKKQQSQLLKIVLQKYT